MGIIDKIGKGPVCIDTCVFIYYIEEHPSYIGAVAQIFEAIDNGHLVAVTSGITLIETLVIPLRKRDNNLAKHYQRLLMESDGLKLLELNKALLYRGALLRATLGIKTPDALQIAAAQLENCTTFITNDRRLPNLKGLEILQLSDFNAERVSQN